MQCGSTNELVLLEILETKCAPILFYEIDAISISSNIKQAINKAWKWAIRVSFGLRRHENMRLLFKYCNLLLQIIKLTCVSKIYLDLLKNCAGSNLLHLCVTLAKNSSYYNNLLHSSVALSNIVYINTICFISIVLLVMLTHYVLIMQYEISLMNIVLVLI